MQISGDASAVQQALAAEQIEPERTRVVEVEMEGMTHLTFRVLKYTSPRCGA